MSPTGMSKFAFCHGCVLLAAFVLRDNCAAEPPLELRVGRAAHAFDHLGNIGEQAETAAACGATVLYTSGYGALAGYEGLPPPDELQKAHDSISAYIKRAKSRGIQLAIGYVCATSVVRLKTFDRNWTDDFRKKFASPPSQWLQVDRTGKPLTSWYKGDYSPACMNNPDWRTYERNVVRLQLEAGHDGIFFDNPTVHPEGCYCDHCLEKFARFLRNKGVVFSNPTEERVASLRQLAVHRPREFLRFRSTIAQDFLADMRAYARTLKPQAYVTCNNSLNTPDVFYSQNRRYGYNIYELSQVEDWVTVEDMLTQPRVLPNGKVYEYGSNLSPTSCHRSWQASSGLYDCRRRLSHPSKPSSLGHGGSGGTSSFLSRLANLAPITTAQNDCCNPTASEVCS
jgi:hypothetical protein